MMKTGIRFALMLLALSPGVLSQAGYASAEPAKVIVDTDIGDDIDDAYALALLLNSPEVKILGVTTAFGDTQLRARLVSRLLQKTGNQSIPVFAGPKTATKAGLSQAAWARQSADRTCPDAISFILQTIRAHPGEVTLISLAPLTNVGALIDKDPGTFRQLKRVVLMGGSIHRGYGDLSGGHPAPEWNIVSDIPAAKALFHSGVPLYVMPLDSTQIDLDLAQQKLIFDRGLPITSALQQLTQEWSEVSGRREPTLFDVVAAAYAVRTNLCPMKPMHIEVDDRGMTNEVAGRANAYVCLQSSEKSFFDFFLPRLTH